MYEDDKVTIEKAKKLPDGWCWIKYEDGSGCLKSPQNESYMIYDLQCNEYQFNRDALWSTIIEDIEYYNKRLNPFDVMENNILRYHKELLVSEHSKERSHELE